MNQFLHKLIADHHGDPDEAVVVGLIAVLLYMGMGIYSCFTDPVHFSFMSFGGGFGAMAGGIGGWMFGKKDRQRDQGVPQ